MRRTAVVLLLLVGVALAGAKGTGAEATPPITIQNGFCFQGPYNTLTPCPTSPTPSPVLPAPIKQLQVSAGTGAPAGTTSYQVNITSKIACFPLNEPIYLYAMGNPGIAALTQFYPEYVPSKGSPVLVHVDQHVGTAGSGTAQLSLEVFNAEVGPAGLNLKAVWPQENVERIQPVIAPSPPTATPTGTAGGPTSTATSVPTATASPSPTVTGTPPATATASPAATATAAQFFVQTCVDPLTLTGHTLGGGNGTLYGRTVPGATCFPSILYSTGFAPNDTQYLSEVASGEVADANGVVAFPFAEDSSGDYGIGAVTCTYLGVTKTAYTYFFIQQKMPPGPQPGGVCPPQLGNGTTASADVTDLNPPQGANETVEGCLTVGGAAAANIPVTAYFHFFDHESTCSSQTDSTGTARCTIKIGNALPNYPVVVETVFDYPGQTYVAVTAFTPVCSLPSCQTSTP